MYHQSDIQQFYVLPTECIYVFCVDLKTNRDYCLYKITCLVFITKAESIYYAVRTAYLNQIQFRPSVVNTVAVPHMDSSCEKLHKHQTLV
jgi:hypothetical protein